MNPALFADDPPALDSTLETDLGAFQEMEESGRELGEHAYQAVLATLETFAVATNCPSGCGPLTWFASIHRARS